MDTLALVWPWCGLGVALVWPWCGFGVALVWLWCGFVLRSLCLVYAYYMALQWLWVALPGLSAFRLLVLRSNIAEGGMPSSFSQARGWNYE